MSAVTDVRAALRAADIVVSVTSLGGEQALIGPDDVGSDAIVVPVDYAAQVTPELVRSASTFAVDEVETFRSIERVDVWLAGPTRSRHSPGWPRPAIAASGAGHRASP